MFYIMSQQSHSIIELSDTPPTQDDLKKLAQERHLDLYVIEGERAGIEYTRPMVDPLRREWEDAHTGTPCPPMESVIR